MKQFPLSPYHQFSNSSLNSDFYDRYLSHDGHQPLQTPLIGIERTQDLLSLKLPPHGHDDQDSQRFPKEWSFAEDHSKQHDEPAEAPATAAPTATALARQKPASAGNRGKNEKAFGRQSGAAAESGKPDSGGGIGSSLMMMMSRQNMLNHNDQRRETDEAQQQQPVEISSGFFFRYNRSNSSPQHSKSSRQSSGSADVAGDGGPEQAGAEDSDSNNHNNYDEDDDDDDDNDHDEGENDDNNNNNNDDNNLDNDHDDEDDLDNESSKGQDMFVESMKHFNPLKRNHPGAANIVAGDHSDDGVCYDLRSKNSSPDHHQRRHQRQSGAGSEHSDSDNATSLSQQYHGQESCFGLDPSKQRFQYVLAAPISVATKLTEDTMTYLNQGQAYEIKLGNTTDVAEARKGFMCSIINIGFHERHMQQAENELWQQWSQQHPNEKIFSVDMKLSYNVYGVDSDGLNKYEFLWDSSKAAGVFIRINSISTEFTPKKHGGEKGVPFRLSIETFSYNSKTHDSYFISAASCQIKVFKPKGAERKIRSDRDKIHKRPPSEQDKYHRSCDHTTFRECPLSSLHPMADTSLCYYRHSHGHFASKQVSTSVGASGGSGGSSASLAQTHGHQNGAASHSSDDELDQQQQQHATSGNGMSETSGLEQNNRSSASHRERDAASPSGHHQQQSNSNADTGLDEQHHLKTNDPPYQSASAYHRLSATALPYHHSSLDQPNHHPSNNDLTPFNNNNNSTGNGNAPTQQAANSELNHHGQHQYPAASTNHQVVRAGLTAGINNASQHFHGMTAHYYGHPLPAALVPPHHHAHMAPTPGYGIGSHASSALTGPMPHPVASTGFSLPHSHHPLQDVKSSIYHRHHQLVGGADKQPFGQHAAAAAMTASYGAAAAFKSHHHNSATNLGQLTVANSNYQSYFVASSTCTSATAEQSPDCPASADSLPHDQQTGSTKDHHNSHNHPHHHNQQQQQHNNNNNPLANNSACYSDNYNNQHHQQPQLHSLRQRSASTSLATAHCQSPYARHHLDNYFTSAATTTGSNENLSSSSSSQNNTNTSNSNGNHMPHNNQWASHQNSGAPINHYTGAATGHNYQVDCDNLQPSDSPSSCCSRYKNGSIHQPCTMSQSTNESVKCPSSGAHITINSSCVEVVSWFASNRFGVLAKTFTNFSGADLLRLSKTELIEICGLIEGIRLFNSLHNQPIKPRRVLYICLGTDDIYHPIYLYDLTLDELLGEITSILESNSRANSDDNDGNSHHTKTGKTNSSSSSGSGSSSDSRSSSRPLSAEMNDDEVYQSEQYYEEIHNSGCSDENKVNNNDKSTLEPSMQQQQHSGHQIDRLLVDGVASVKVAASEKVVHMLEDESVWTLSVQTKLSGSIEACITACRAHKRHCK